MRIFHASAPDPGDYDRIGLVFRYLTPEVRQIVAEGDYSMLVREVDRGQNWIHVAPPAGNYDAADLRLRQLVQQDQAVTLGEGATREMHAAY